MSQTAILLLNFTCVALLYVLLFVHQKLQLRPKNFCRFMIFGYRLQKFLFAFIAIIPITFLSCNQKQNNSSEQELASNDSTVFYPLHQYFIDQIKSVDSAAPRIKMFRTIDGEKDSTAISTQQFNEIAQTFLENDIEDKSIKKYYKQSIFQDQTTQSITFNYTTVNSSLPVQSVDILLDTTTQEVKRVFISKIKTAHDSTIIEKLNWKTNSSFLISRSVQLPSNEETTEQISLEWGDNN
jgi:hypothetical protein